MSSNRKVVSEKDFWGVGDDDEDGELYGDESWTAQHHTIITDSDDEDNDRYQYEDYEELESVNRMTEARAQQQQQNKKNQQQQKKQSSFDSEDEDSQESSSSSDSDNDDDDDDRQSNKLKLYEEDDDGFTTFIGKKAAAEKLAKLQKAKQSSSSSSNNKNDDENGENGEQEQQQQKKKKKRSKKSKKSTQSATQKFLNQDFDPRDPLAGVEDPFDLLAEQHENRIRMKAQEQKLAHQKLVKKQKAILPTSKQPAANTKNQKLSGITKLVFEQPKTGANEKQQQKKKKKKAAAAVAAVTAATGTSGGISPTTPSSTTSLKGTEMAAAKTVEGVAEQLNVNDLKTTIEKVRQTYSKESASQFVQVAGWFEKEFYHISAKTIPQDIISHFSKDFVSRVNKWLTTLHDKSVTEAVTLFIEQIYSDKGIERQVGKAVGTRVFLQFIFRARPMAAAEGIISCSSTFANGTVSIQNMKYLVDSLRYYNEFAGIKAAVSIILTHLLSNKLKSKDEQDEISYLRQLIESDRVMNLSEQYPDVVSLVDKKQFLNFQNYALSSKSVDVENLYQDLVAISVFFTNSSPSIFFTQQLEALRTNSTSKERTEDIVAILSKSIKIDEECINLWVSQMSKYMKESITLLDHINRHGGLQGVKGSEQISKQMALIINSAPDKGVPEIEALRQQLKSFTISNTESSIVGAFFRFIIVIFILSALAILSTILYCGNKHDTQFCKVNEPWLSAFVGMVSQNPQ